MSGKMVKLEIVELNCNKNLEMKRAFIKSE